jgi:hypothetical protein
VARGQTGPVGSEAQVSEEGGHEVGGGIMAAHVAFLN